MDKHHLSSNPLDQIAPSRDGQYQLALAGANPFEADLRGATMPDGKKFKD